MQLCHTSGKTERSYLKAVAILGDRSTGLGGFGALGGFVSSFKIAGSSFTAACHKFCTRLQFMCHVFNYSKHY